MKSNSQPSRAIDGIQLSIESLVTAYHGDVFRSALFLTGKADEAEDLTQQTYLQAMQKLEQLRHGGSARSWLLAILRNCFLQDRRRQREIPWDQCESIVEDEPDSDGTAPLGMDIDPSDVVKATQSLDEHHRLVITMFYFERRSYQEIAQELGIKLGTVMSRLSRAKQQLRRQLLLKHHS